VTPRLDMVGLVVRNMSASLAFYRLLGLDIPAGSDGEEHVEATLPGGLRLAWDTPAVMHIFDPGWTPATGGAAFGLAFLVDSPDEVDALYAKLTGLGYAGHIEPFDAFWGQRYAVVKDPDGNDVALFAGNPES
jgi:catechol 2,3-dioxygenase-like lactoylglutathione lyase family enzyme